MLTHQKITPIPNDEPDAVPALWNTRYLEIDENFAGLDGRQEDVEGELEAARGNEPNLATRVTKIAEALGMIESEFGSISGTSAVSVQRAVTLDWLYRDNRVALELWGPGFTLINFDGSGITQGVSGDDSIDIESTAGIVVGEYYVVHDETGSVLVRIQAVLSEVRLRLYANLPRNFASGNISRCSMSIVPSIRAEAGVGSIWLSKIVNIGSDAEGGAIVIRRTLNSGLARVYFRDSLNLNWVERKWSMRRQGGDIPAGFADYEYALPMRGDGSLRVDVEGEPMIIQHIVSMSAATGLGGFANPEMRPATPVITAPGNGATGIMERPTLGVIDYTSPGGTQQAGIQFQVSTTSNFLTVHHDSGTQSAGLSYSMPAAVLQLDTTYYVRARVVDAAGLISDWSATTSFTTDASFSYVSAPTLVSPANNATDVGETPTLQTGSFSTVGGEDTQAASQWQIRAASGTWATPVWDSGEDTVNLLSRVVPADKLSAGGTVYYIRARHKGTARGWSEYSTEVKVTTKAAFANVSGVVLLTTGGNGGAWGYVDEDGNTVAAPGSSFFNSHPIWGGIQEVLIDGQTMMKVPKFYIRKAVISGGANNGKTAWWISDQALEGYTLHPAFRHYGNDIDQFYVGKYQASMTGTKLDSKPGVLPTVSRTLTQFQIDAQARNVSGVSGFGQWTVYQWSAIQWLYIVENATMDSQTKTGQGRVNAASAANVDASDVMQATYRGITGLWGNVWQWMDGLKLVNGVVHIWDRDGNRSWIPTGQNPPNMPGATYPTTFMDASGEGFDLDDVFIAKTGPTTNTDATAPDYQYFGNAGEFFSVVGGYWASASSAGLLCLTVYNPASYSNTHLGSRLAKV